MLLARFCGAGPVVGWAVDVAGIVGGDAAAAAVAGSSIAAAFGITSSAVWYGGFVVIDGALYYGATAAVGTTMAGASK